MLHKIVTASLVLVGLVIAGLSVASGTVWRPSDTAVMTTGPQSGATLVTTAPGVLGLVDDSVTISASSSPDATVVLAIGRAVDVAGWIGDSPALVVTGASDWETLTVTSDLTEAVPSPEAPTEEAPTEEAPTEEAPAEEAPAEEAPAEEAPAEEAPAEEAPAEPAPAEQPDPQGSDMWLASAVGSGTASLAWDASSSDRVLLAAAVGENATTPEVTLSWPRTVTTPLMWPGIVLGALLIIAGGVYGYLTLRRRGTTTTAPTNRSASRTGARTAPTPSVDSTGTGTGTGTGSGTAGRSATARPGAPSVALPGAAGGAGDDSRTGLTRRELREQAARDEEARLEEVNAAARRTKRAWPWTGAIPTVKKHDAAPPTPEPAAVDPARPVWLPEGTASTSGSSWRQAWGVRPETESPAADAGTASLRPTDGSAPQNNPTEGH